MGFGCTAKFNPSRTPFVCESRAGEHSQAVFHRDFGKWHVRTHRWTQKPSVTENPAQKTENSIQNQDTTNSTLQIEEPSWNFPGIQGNLLFRFFYSDIHYLEEKRYIRWDLDRSTDTVNIYITDMYRKEFTKETIDAAITKLSTLREGVVNFKAEEFPKIAAELQHYVQDFNNESYRSSLLQYCPKSMEVKIYSDPNGNMEHVKTVLISYMKFCLDDVRSQMKES
ncbi:uncharacterized protein LOC110455372 [Mizuhopecten yessoensis]|uniref:uncharacterized protein LOC110455372 n=1 Tax=Mizuhopecten yessoensis TaxID=6573 RepID=UPI000B459CC0|nr:uncharacterized protein LOC110455372 [Mizuhopecten yessoensis]